MKLLRGLGPRILIVSALMAALATVGINIVLARLTLEVAAARAGGFLSWAAEGELGAQCRAAPSSFLFSRDDGLQLWAIDGTTLISANPASPVVPEALREALAAGDTHASALGRGTRLSGGAMVQRVSAQGPCAVMVAKWPRSDDVVGRGFVRVLIIAGLAILLVMMLGMLVIVRPLLARIRALKEAAAGVGHEGAYTTHIAPPVDELDEVRAALDRAHLRIVDDAAALVAKNRALVEHLSDVAHDLRTPIAALQLKLERLGTQGLSPSEAEDARAAALADALYLEALTENLRFAATLREGLEVERATCDLRDVTLRVEARLGVLARHRGIELAAAVPDDPVVVDVARVVAERLLSNLVYNAIVHHGPPREAGARAGDAKANIAEPAAALTGGKAAALAPADLVASTPGHVAVLLDVREGRFVWRVIDDGPGLPLEVKAHLTATDLRNQGASLQSEGGSGLGLFIVGALSRNAGFSVEVEDPDEGGCAIVLSGTVLVVPS